MAVGEDKELLAEVVDNGATAGESEELDEDEVAERPMLDCEELVDEEVDERIEEVTEVANLLDCGNMLE